MIFLVMPTTAFSEFEKITKRNHNNQHVILQGREFTIENLFDDKQPQLPGALDNETFEKAKIDEGYLIR